MSREGRERLTSIRKKEKEKDPKPSTGRKNRLHGQPSDHHSYPNRTDKQRTHPQNIIHQSPPPRPQLDQPHPPPSTLRDPLGDKEKSQEFPEYLTDLGRGDEIALTAKDVFLD